MGSNMLKPSQEQSSREMNIHIHGYSTLHIPAACQLLQAPFSYRPRRLWPSLQGPPSQQPAHSSEPMDWSTRIKIAAGTAKGLEYLHHQARPPVIHRDLKPSSILLSEGFQPKLSSFGWAKLGPIGSKTFIRTSIVGTNGYMAPEYAIRGELSLKSDVYSFGVILLELITGRRAMDSLRCAEESNLVVWVHPYMQDEGLFTQLADPKRMLQSECPGIAGPSLYAR